MHQFEYVFVLSMFGHYEQDTKVWMGKITDCPVIGKTVSLDDYYEQFAYRINCITGTVEVASTNFKGWHQISRDAANSAEFGYLPYELIKQWEV